MSIIANTFTRYDSVGIREDLSNIIYSIDPTDRPFMSNMTKSRKVTNTFFEWQTQSLSSSSANHHIDGDDLSSTFLHSRLLLQPLGLGIIQIFPGRIF